MKTQIKDERVTQETWKQNSLAFVILYYGVLLDLLYKQFILQEPITRYWDVALLFFGVSFFLVIKRINSGLLNNKFNLKSVIPSTILATAVFAIINYWWLGRTSPVELVTNCVGFLITFGATFLLMQYLSNRRNESMLKDE